MPKTVQVPGVGNVEFPDNMSDDAIGAAITKQLKPAAKPDALESALNYHTGSSLVDAPLGLVQGAAKGVLNTAYKGSDLLRKVPGVAAADDAIRSLYGGQKATPAQEDAYTKPNGIGQGTGKFLEQAAEFAVPAGAVSKLTKSAGLAARALGQGAVGAGVSAAQSGGDPTSTVVGGALGGGGELAGAVLSGAKNLLAAKAPTLANFAESFGFATPTQKARISGALDTLKKDGIVPPDSVHETQDVIKGKLDDLGKAYQNLDPAIKAREVAPTPVISELQKAQQQFTRRGVVTDQAGYDALKAQIKTVQAIADKNNGKINIDDIVHLKQNANGRTNFQSPQADQNVWKSIGNAYRSAADTLAPETTPLNRDYQKYKDLEQIIDQNIDRGKGTTPSGLDVLKQKMVAHSAGGMAGAALLAPLGPVGAAVGGLAGTIIGPKVGKTAAQAIQNAVDAGTFQSLSPVKQNAVKLAAKFGDNAAVIRLLSGAATQETAVTASR